MASHCDIPMPIVDVIGVLRRAGADPLAAEGSHVYLLAAASVNFEVLLDYAEDAVNTGMVDDLRELVAHMRREQHAGAAQGGSAR